MKGNPRAAGRRRLSRVGALSVALLAIGCHRTAESDGGPRASTPEPPAPLHEWMPPDCGGLRFQSRAAAFPTTCTSGSEGVVAHLQVRDIAHVVVVPTSGWPDRLELAFTNWRFEHFTLRAQQRDGSHRILCGRSALRDSCDVPEVTAQTETKHLGERDLGEGMKVPVEEMTVTVVMAPANVGLEHALEIGWIDAYRQ